MAGVQALSEELRDGVLLDGAERRRLAEMVTAKASRRFGKGPASCKVVLVGDVVTLKATDILTPLEKLLAQAGQKELVLQARKHAFKALRPGFEDIFARFDLRVVAASAVFDVDRNDARVSFRVQRA